jgi:hypothetical protein
MTALSKTKTQDEKRKGARRLAQRSAELIYLWRVFI